MEDTLESRPPSRLFFHEIELMAGFQEDFKSLIEKVVELFKQKRSLRFEHFVAVWKEMSFSLVILFGLFRLELSAKLVIFAKVVIFSRFVKLSGKLANLVEFFI